MKNKEIKDNKEQYIAVPASWFKQLIEIAKKSPDYDKLAKQFLIGYISSAGTILKYVKKLDENVL